MVGVPLRYFRIRGNFLDIVLIRIVTPPRFLQLGGHFGGDRADGDSGNIVEKIQLGDLLMAHELRHQEQHGKGTERRDAKNHKINLRSPLCP